MVALNNMTDQSSINFISSVLSGKSAPAETDNEKIASLIAVYPYFVPARYLGILSDHLTKPLTPAMKQAALPYRGNWILFNDFLNVKERAQNLPPAEAITVPQPELIAPVTTAQTKENTTVVAEEKAMEKEIIAEPVVIIIEEKKEPVVVEIVEVLEIPAEIIVTEVEPEISQLAEESLITPVFSQDYFLHEGEKISEEISFELKDLKPEVYTTEEDKSLMVMMSFSEWLLHFKHSAEREKEETKDQKALKTMWQKEKLAAAMEEENEEIPEKVFEMAVNSISKEEGLASETLANIYIKQGKYDQAIEMYRKLSLRNPQKNAYFARKIEDALKDKQS